MTSTLTPRKASVAFRGFFYDWLFIFYRVTGLLPGLPATLKRKYAFVSLVHKGSCHPGTRSLALSGTIEYQGLIFAVFFYPLFHFGWILSHGSWNFLAASPPVSVFAYIYDHCIRTAQPLLNLMNGNPGYVPGVACNRNRCPADNQQKYATRHHRRNILLISHSLPINPCD